MYTVFVCKKEEVPMEAVILGLFVAGLIACVAGGVNVIAALVWGLGLFSFYAWKQGFSLRQIGRMLWEGVAKISNIVLVMFCIGTLTAAWRICGTIPYIVYHAAGLIVPRYFILCAFFLCIGISFITGSAFSTASTVGAICMMLGRATGVAPVPLAGAILAGSFWGDRCSPMSSSALLVASITRTDVYDNIKTMLRTAAVPLVISCVLYFLMGSDPQNAGSSALGVFERSFALRWPLVLPALLTLTLCLMRVEVKKTMLLSTALSVILALWLQKVPLGEVLRCLVLGYHPAHDAELSALLAGGGMISMLNVVVIICLSSSYSGIFEKTKLLSGVGQALAKLAQRTTRQIAFTIAAILSCMIACNQTLATLLTEQLLRPIVPDDRERASWLEDTAIIIAPLVPWTIAAGVPLAILDADSRSILYACYLYLIPLWLILRSLWRKHKK